jgi:hypothetical protein
MNENFIYPKSPNFESEMKLLDKLPYAITVHNNFDKIVYENAIASELFGIRIDDVCKSRWCHHSDYIANSCPMCPGKFTKKDRKPHKVFRKLVDSNLNIRYVEFESIPIINANNEIDGYIEIVRDVTEGESIKVKNLEFDFNKKEERIYSLLKHGMTGSEIILSDKIYFTDRLQEFLMKLGTFTFIGVLQNNKERVGLYGPLPVLDEKNYEMYAYSFSTTDMSIIDPRKNHNEIILLLMIFERNDKIVTINRQLINDLIYSYTQKLSSVEDLNQEWFNLVKIELNKLIDT